MNPLGDDSYMYLDITSSCPWSFSFNFSIVSDSPGDFFVAKLTGPWTGIGDNVGLIDTTGGDNDNPNDYFFYVTEDGGIGYPVTQSNLPGTVHPGSPPSRSGGTWNWDTYGAKDLGLGQSYFTGSGGYPIPSGEYRLSLQYRFSGNAGAPTVGFVAIDRLQFRVYDDSCFPIDTTSRIGANNYPDFRVKDSDIRADPTYESGLPAEWSGSTWLQDRTSDIYAGINYGISPVIRGWKYGLYSGLPMNSKSIFRRERFGQFRDMLEQRHYTKFINVGISPVDDEAVVQGSFNKQVQSSLTKAGAVGSLGPAAAEVKFVRQQYEVDGRGIGRIYNEKVDPLLTVSQNLSAEVTSSLPYFDGVARHRAEDTFAEFNILNQTLSNSIIK
jgi:hypothetical protein